jgi:tryptophan 2,3-dioxygenase
MTDSRSLSYHDYLQLDRLLSAQLPPDMASGEVGATRPLLHHDELLFVVMHQTMELWFKMVIADLEAARDLLDRDQVPERDVPQAREHLNRGARLFSHLTQQFGIIETMPATNFLSFRDALIPASGFQSWQFREVEILAGLDNADRVQFEGRPYTAKMDDEVRERLETRESEKSLRGALFDWLGRTPVEEAFPNFVATFQSAYDAYIDEQRAHQRANTNLAPEQAAAIDRRFEAAKKEMRGFFATGNADADRAHAAFVFIATYRDHPLLSWPWALLDTVLEFEEHFRIFRFRHARMVERMIGLRVGSGGSSGVSYLDETASRYRIFGDLLKATSYLIDRDRLPAVPESDILGFHFNRR